MGDAVNRNSGNSSSFVQNVATNSGSGTGSVQQGSLGNHSVSTATAQRPPKVWFYYHMGETDYPFQYDLERHGPLIQEFRDIFRHEGDVRAPVTLNHDWNELGARTREFRDRFAEIEEAHSPRL